MRRFVYAIVVCSLFSTSALAKDIYVSSETGDNDAPGTKEKPKKLLWKVLQEYAAGDVIHVAQGYQWGQNKAGVFGDLPASVTLEGGWKSDFSVRDPFKYLTIITAGFDAGGATREVFRIEDTSRKTVVTIDGFVFDRGGSTSYMSTGEMGANNAIEGHADNSPFGYRNENKKTSGSDPTIELIGAQFFVRNNIIINSPWWGIYIKVAKDSVIENNLIIGYQGRGIEAIAGGGWGQPTITIRNNTVAFGYEMEGRGISTDPRDDSAHYVIDNNVVAYSYQGGITDKFQANSKILSVSNNLFYFNRYGDYSSGGSPGSNVADWDDSVNFKQKGNKHELPKFTAKIFPQYFHRYSMTQDLVNQWSKDGELIAARKAAGLPEAYNPVGFEKTYKTYAELPEGRASYDNSRFPYPQKIGGGLSVEDYGKYVLPILGADGERGVQAKAVTGK